MCPETNEGKLEDKSIRLLGKLRRDVPLRVGETQLRSKVDKIIAKERAKLKKKAEALRAKEQTLEDRNRELNEKTEGLARREAALEDEKRQLEAAKALLWERETALDDELVELKKHAEVLGTEEEATQTAPAQEVSGLQEAEALLTEKTDELEAQESKVHLRERELLELERHMKKRQEMLDAKSEFLKAKAATLEAKESEVKLELQRAEQERNQLVEKIAWIEDKDKALKARELGLSGREDALTARENGSEGKAHELAQREQALKARLEELRVEGQRLSERLAALDGRETSLKDMEVELRSVHEKERKELEYLYKTMGDMMTSLLPAIIKNMRAAGMDTSRLDRFLAQGQSLETQLKSLNKPPSAKTLLPTAERRSGKLAQMSTGAEPRDVTRGTPDLSKPRVTEVTRASGFEQDRQSISTLKDEDLSKAQIRKRLASLTGIERSALTSKEPAEPDEPYKVGATGPLAGDSKLKDDDIERSGQSIAVEAAESELRQRTRTETARVTARGEHDLNARGAPRHEDDDIIKQTITPQGEASTSVAKPREKRITKNDTTADTEDDGK